MELSLAGVLREWRCTNAGGPQLGAATLQAWRTDPAPRSAGDAMAIPSERPSFLLAMWISLWAKLGCVIDAHVQSLSTGPACFPFKAELKPPVRSHLTHYAARVA